MAGKYCSRQKHRRFPAVALTALLLTGLCIAVWAYYIQKTQQAEHPLTLAAVSCQTQEAVSGNQKTSIQVTNTGTVPVYIRVRLVSYWQTPSGSIAGRGSEAPKLTEDELGPNWLPAANDTYYYKKPVDPGEQTDNLLDTGKVILLKTEEGYIQVVEVLAEAIQAAPADAVKEAWGVTPNADGEIT